MATPVPIAYFFHLIKQVKNKVFSWPLPHSFLKNRDFILEGDLLKKRTLLPFFSNNGDIAKLLMIDVETSAIDVLDVKPNQMRVGVFGVINLDGLSEMPRIINDDDMEVLEKLWHYDPWWLLDNENFTSHQFRHRLKATNCAKFINKRVNKIFFSNDLTRIEGVLCLNINRPVFKKWNSNYILVIRQPSYSKEKKDQDSTWVLDPIWTRW